MTVPPLPLYVHSLMVHLPLGVLTVGVLFDIAGYFSPKSRGWLFPASKALLWVGTVGLLAATLTGRWGVWGHAPSASSALMSDHAFLAYWVTGVFGVLAFWRTRWVHHASPIFTMTWMAAISVLWATAWWGTALAYRISPGKVF